MGAVAAPVRVGMEGIFPVPAASAAAAMIKVTH